MRDSRLLTPIVGLVILAAIAFYGGVPVRRVQVASNTVTPARAPSDVVQGTQLNPCADDPVTRVLCGYYGTKAGDESPGTLFRQSGGRVVIATVPDPSESYVGYEFDTAIEALRSAAVETGLEPDRFYLPWGASAEVRVEASNKRVLDEKGSEILVKKLGHAAPNDSVDRVWPGAMLFRGSDPQHDTLLLLVGESPVVGVQPEQLRIALEKAWWLRPDEAQIRSQDDPPPIAIVGPSFSGSAESLQKGIQTWATKCCCACTDNAPDQCPGPCPQAMCPSLCGLLPVRVVSGPTTGQGVKSIIERDGLARVEQIAMLLPTVWDNIENRFLPKEQRKEETKGEMKERRARMMVVLESGTSFGGAEFFRDKGIRVLRYPLHVGQMRDAATDEGPAGLELDASGRLSLSLADERDPLDIPPPIFPRLTRNVTDIAIAQGMKHLQDDGTELVGIIGTNALDVGFIASRIRAAAPNVQIVVVEWDNLFAHPQLAKDMFGTWVFTSFAPGDSASRLLGQPRYIHGNSTAAGIFEAARRVFSSKSEPMDPQLWLGMVGSNAIWPVKLFPEGTHALVRSSDVVPCLVQQRERAATPNSLFWILNVFGGYLLIAWVRRFTVKEGRRPRLLLPRAFYVPMAGTTKAFRGVRVGSSAALLTAMAAAVVPLSYSPDLVGEWTVMLLALPVTGTLALLAMMLLDATEDVLDVSPLSLTLLIGAVTFVLWVWHRPSAPDLNMFLQYERVTTLASGLTPLAPLLLLGLALAIMMIAHARREWLPRKWFVDTLKDIDARARSVASPVRSELLAMRELLSSLLRSICLREEVREPRRPVGGVAVSLLIGVIAAGVAGVALVEHHLPGRLDPISECLALVEICLLFGLTAHGIGYSLVVWLRLRRFLRYLMWTPLVEAFDRLPQQLDRHFSLRLSSTAAFAGALRLPLEQINTIAAMVPPLSGKTAINFRDIADRVTKRHEDERGNRAVDWSKLLAIETETFHLLCGAAVDVYAETATIGQMTLPVLNFSERNDKKVSDETDTITALRRQRRPTPVPQLCEEFVATMLTSVMSFAFVQIKNMLLATSVAVVLMLLAVASYPFMGQRALIARMMILIASLVGVVLTMLITMDTNEILSRISNRTPGKVEVDATFLEPMLTYAGVPVLVALATYFPSLRQDVHGLVGWFIR